MTKIMLVEDDKSLREIYDVRLRAEGYDIKYAGDGEEALAMAIRERPDLIISDVMMPKISGFDMLDILRSTPETKDVKVIMMTALSSEDQRARGESLGANRYLVKSQVGIEDVVRTVHEVLADNINPNLNAQPIVNTENIPEPTTANQQFDKPSTITEDQSTYAPSPAFDIIENQPTQMYQPEPEAETPSTKPVQFQQISRVSQPLYTSQRPTVQTTPTLPTDNQQVQVNIATIPQNQTQQIQPELQTQRIQPAPRPFQQFSPVTPVQQFSPKPIQTTEPRQEQPIRQIIQPREFNDIVKAPTQPFVSAPSIKPSSLPQPTAPFSTPAPVSLGADFAAQAQKQEDLLNQELINHNIFPSQNNNQTL